MFFIQRHDGRELETVDSFGSKAEARAMLREYATADGFARYYVSTRPTRAWRAAEAEAARPRRVRPARPLPAYLDSFAGLIPVSILAAVSDGSAVRFELRFTGRRANLPDAYKAGGLATHGLGKVVPRHAIARRRGCAVVRPFAWVDSFPQILELAGVARASA